MGFFKCNVSPMNHIALFLSIPNHSARHPQKTCTYFPIAATLRFFLCCDLLRQQIREHVSLSYSRAFFMFHVKEAGVMCAARAVEYARTRGVSRWRVWIDDNEVLIRLWQP